MPPPPPPPPPPAMLPAGKLLTWQLLYLFASHASAINNFAQRYHYDAEDARPKTTYSRRAAKIANAGKKRFDSLAIVAIVMQIERVAANSFSLEEENLSSRSSLSSVARGLSHEIASLTMRDGASRES